MQNINGDIQETSFGENELMTLGDLAGQGAVQKYSDDDFDEMAVGSFLPRLQLMTANSAPCKAGEFPVNHWAFIRDQNSQDVGESLDVLVCAWRPMALAFGENTSSVHDRKSAEFLDIQARADKKEDGFMWGYQALVWTPSVGSFATYFAGSPTARRAFPTVKSEMNGPATFGSKKIDNGTHVWFGPTCVECSTPFDMPEKDEYQKQMEKFNNPVASKNELVVEEEGRAQ